MNIKDCPELRHALSHMYIAIKALAEGSPKECLYELESIEALIFFEDDEHCRTYIENIKEK